MADIEVTDDLGKPAPAVKIDLSHPSSLLKYAKSELLRMTVAPDFIARALEREDNPIDPSQPNRIVIKSISARQRPRRT